MLRVWHVLFGHDAVNLTGQFYAIAGRDLQPGDTVPAWAEFKPMARCRCGIYFVIGE